MAAIRAAPVRSPPPRHTPAPWRCTRQTPHFMATWLQPLRKKGSDREETGHSALEHVPPPAASQRMPGGASRGILARQVRTYIRSRQGSSALDGSRPCVAAPSRSSISCTTRAVCQAATRQPTPFACQCSLGACGRSNCPMPVRRRPRLPRLHHATILGGPGLIWRQDHRPSIGTASPPTYPFLPALATLTRE